MNINIKSILVIVIILVIYITLGGIWGKLANTIGEKIRQFFIKLLKL